MSLSWFITNTVSALLLPPLIFIIPSIAGFLLQKRWPRFGAVLCILPLIALVFFSTGVGAKWLAASIERQTRPLLSPQTTSAQAIVILGGGRSRNAPEFDNRDIVSYATLGRLRYGAKLHRATGLPILVTGGTPDGSLESEAALMARTLVEDFGVAARWQEQASDNTAQNARFSAQQLKQAGIERILLVTDAIHMPRSHSIFNKNGLQVIPAPTMFFSRGNIGPIDFIPKAKWLKISAYAMHEGIGMVWYWLRHGSSPLEP